MTRVGCGKRVVDSIGHIYVVVEPEVALELRIVLSKGAVVFKVIITLIIVAVGGYGSACTVVTAGDSTVGLVLDGFP